MAIGILMCVVSTARAVQWTAGGDDRRVLFIVFEREAVAKAGGADALLAQDSGLLECLRAIGSTSVEPLFDLRVNRPRKVAMDMDLMYVVSLAGDMVASDARRVLSECGRIRSVHQESYGTLSCTPNDEYYGLNWYHANTAQNVFGLPTTADMDSDTEHAWDVTTGDPEIRIAILDTGCVQDHEEFQGRIASGRNFIADRPAHEWHDDDIHGHGSAVAGVAAARGNNEVGVAGVAWDCTLLIARIVDSQQQIPASAVAQALEWAVDNGARVVNISGGDDDLQTPEVDAALGYAVGEDVLIVAASGNNQGDDAVDYPASDGRVIAVGAHNPMGQRPSWSNGGPELELSAPGDRSVFVGKQAGQYPNDHQGTSFAAPHVAGIAALVMSAHPEFSAPEVRLLLQATCDPVDPPGRDNFTGFGRVNASRAVTGAAPPYREFVHVDWRSNGSGGAPFTTIAAGLAAMSAGNELHVASGAYTEVLTFTVPGWVRSRCGGDVVIGAAGGTALERLHRGER